MAKQHTKMLRIIKDHPNGITNNELSKLMELQNPSTISLGNMLVRMELVKKEVTRKPHSHPGLILKNIIWRIDKNSIYRINKLLEREFGYV